MNRFPRLFSTLKLGPYVLKNRIESAPMGVHGTPEGYITPEGTAYYELRARGGAAIVMGYEDYQELMPVLEDVRDMPESEGKLPHPLREYLAEQRQSGAWVPGSAVVEGSEITG